MGLDITVEQIEPATKARSRPDLRRIWTKTPATTRFIAALIGLFVAKQIILVLIFPAFSGHDEVAHYAYLQSVAKHGHIPVIPDLAEWRARRDTPDPLEVDWIPDKLYPYCSYTLDWVCDPNSRTYQLSGPPRSHWWPGTDSDLRYPSGWIYTANHPPLYYALLTPVYWLSESASLATQLDILRLASIPLGALTVYLAYRLAGTLFPGDSFLAVSVPAFVAFQPQVSYEAAILNNDVLAITLYSWILYLIIVGIRDRFPTRLCLWLGVAGGLALLAKSTSLTAAPIVALAVIPAVGWNRPLRWIRQGGIIAGLAGLIASPWYVFLYRTYGDLSGLSRIEALQVWNYRNRTPPGILDQLFDSDFAWLRWQETWAEFGWRLIPLSQGLYWLIFWVIATILLGFGAYLVRALLVWRGIESSDDPVLHPARWQMLGLSLLVPTCGIAYYAILEFGTRFELTQARYAFPAINAATIPLMLGLRTLIPRRLHGYGQAALLSALVMLNVIILTGYVIPHWQRL